MVWYLAKMTFIKGQTPMGEQALMTFLIVFLVSWWYTSTMHEYKMLRHRRRKIMFWFDFDKNAQDVYIWKQKKCTISWKEFNKLRLTKQQYPTFPMSCFLSSPLMLLWWHTHLIQTHFNSIPTLCLALILCPAHLHETNQQKMRHFYWLYLFLLCCLSDHFAVYFKYTSDCYKQ